jgi:hypothetical protein
MAVTKETDGMEKRGRRKRADVVTLVANLSFVWEK